VVEREDVRPQEAGRMGVTRVSVGVVLVLVLVIVRNRTHSITSNSAVGWDKVPPEA
jgi:hypothetical protein